MSKMKDRLLETQNVVETKLIQLGIDRDILFTLEELLQSHKTWDEVMELAAGYETFIQIASEITPYSKTWLWSKWMRFVNIYNANPRGKFDLESYWQLFKLTTLNEEWSI